MSVINSLMILISSSFLFTSHEFCHFECFISKSNNWCVSVCVWPAPLGPLITADCIYIQWQEKVNVAVINSCISIRERAAE